MSVSPLAMASAVKSVGKAVPLIGDWLTASGLAALGATEGPITEVGGWSINGLTALEHTGGLLHQAQVTPGALSVSIPLILGDPALYAKIMPTGMEDGPSDNPVNVVETGLWLVPLNVFPEGGTIGYDGTAWTPTGIEDQLGNAVLFGRGFFTPGDLAHPYENGGKAIVTVTFTPMYDDRLPAGKRGWIRGDPVAKGLTTFRV